MSAHNRRFLLLFFLASMLVTQGVAPVNSASPSPRPTTSTQSRPTPTPSPSSTLIPLTAVFSDTNLPNITTIASSTEVKGDQFVLAIAIDVRVKRNTISSLTLGLLPKTTQGAFVDPIFQAPCSKLNNFSVNALNNQGDSLALQSRSPEGDWYVEKYVLTNSSKIGTNQVPCSGQYLVTSISIVDSAKHTLNVVANLASTSPVANSNPGPTPTPTRTSQPNQSNQKYNDNAIMKSNVWNSRLDVAPCTPGTNLLPTVTTTLVNGRSTQVTKDPTISPTDRLACSQAINYDFTKPLFTISNISDGGTGSTIYGTGVNTSLPIVDYAALARQNNSSVDLQKEIDDLKIKNKKLEAQIAKLKKQPVKPKKITASPKTTMKNNRSNQSDKSKQDWQSKTRSSNPKPTSSPTRK
jgi:hypothetical protein